MSTSHGRVALAIRPYGLRLRGRVFDLLGECGVEVVAPPELGDGARDEDIVREVATRGADMLLLPFNILRAPDGARTSGIELLGALRREVEWVRRVPVVMPVSVFAAAAFEAVWAADPLEGVLVLREGELALPETRQALGRFLRSRAA